MGINDLRLSPSLIAALYPDSLINEKVPDHGKTGDEPGLTLSPAQTAYPYLGKNLQSICFLVCYPNDEFMPEEQLAFLQRILVACKCSLDDVAIINTERHPVDFKLLKILFSPRIIFLWGLKTGITGLPQKLPDMTISNWENISLLPVSQPERMSTDHPDTPGLKKDLWVSLKKLFNL